MPISMSHEGVTYELDEVDATWTLEELRDSLANASGSFKVFDAGEWHVLSKGKLVEGERRTLASLGVRDGVKLDVVRVKASNRPPASRRPAPVPAADADRPVTLTFDAVIDIDDAPRPLEYAGLRSRLRDDAARREAAPLPADLKDDALRAVYAAVDDMLKNDEVDRTLTVRDRTLVVRITDD